MSESNIYRDDKVHVQRAMCPTCIFRKDGVELAPGRRDQMVADADAEQGTIICHETLDTDRNAACRGYYDQGQSVTLRLAASLGAIEWVREVWEEYR